MASQRLTLYDIIVDLVPGIVAILLIALVLPVGWFSASSGVQPLNSALILLALGYVTGRSIHAFAARPLVKYRFLPWFDSGFSKHFVDKQTERALDLAATSYASSSDVKGENASNAEVDTIDEAEHKDDECSDPPTAQPKDSLSFSGRLTLGSPEMKDFDFAEQEVIQDVREALRAEVYDTHNTDNETSKSEADNSPEGCSNAPGEDSGSDDEVRLAEEDDTTPIEPNLQFYKHYGQSALFGKNTLFQKYSILSTFYRNLAVVSFVTFHVHLVSITLHFLGFEFKGMVLSGGPGYESVLFSLLGPQLNGYVIGHLFLSVTFFALAVLYGVRRLEFRHREVRAFINDLHREFVVK